MSRLLCGWDYRSNAFGKRRVANYLSPLPAYMFLLHRVWPNTFVTSVGIIVLLPF